MKPFFQLISLLALSLAVPADAIERPTVPLRETIAGLSIEARTYPDQAATERQFRLRAPAAGESPLYENLKSADFEVALPSGAPVTLPWSKDNGVRVQQLTQRMGFEGCWSDTKHPERVSQCLSPRDGHGHPAGADVSRRGLIPGSWFRRSCSGNGHVAGGHVTGGGVSWGSSVGASCPETGAFALRNLGRSQKAYPTHRTDLGMENPNFAEVGMRSLGSPHVLLKLTRFFTPNFGVRV